MRRVVAAGLVAAAAAQGCADGSGTGPVPGVPPTVLRVSPEVLRGGDTAVLHGLNFAADAEENRVEVAGAPASVLAPATRTRLQILVPDAGETACEPTRPVTLSVTVRGRTGTAIHPLASAPLLELEPGEGTAAVTPAGVRCHNLPPGDASYLVSVFNGAPAAGQAVSFRVRGRPGSTADSEAAAAAASPEPSTLPAGGTAAPNGRRSVLARVLRGRIAEAGILERGREVLRRADPLTARRGPPVGRTAADAPPVEGDLLEFRVPDLGQSDACASYHTVTARVVHVSATTVVVEDTAAPLAGAMDGVYRDLAAEYEAVMDPIVRAHFGDPLVFDDRLDDDDHFYMLFTPRVNDIAGALAFVWGGDYTARASCASSDGAELFYGRVPRRTGGGPFDLASVEGWERVMRSITIHEVKHIAAFAAHEAGGSARQEESWLEEASAMVAEELYAREIFGYGRGDNTTYAEGLACELDPAGAGCGDAPLVMAAHFSFLREYLSGLEARSPLGGGVAFLGGGWWLLRWALDHSPAGEPSFLRALTTETGLFGVANLEARAGRAFPEMLADWTLALEADDRPGTPKPERAELTVPSWDVRSVFAGLHEARPASFPAAYPLSPRHRDYGDWLLSLTGLPGGSAVLLEITATEDVRQLLEVLAQDGGAPPSELGFSILRVR